MKGNFFSTSKGRFFFLILFGLIQLLTHVLSIVFLSHSVKM